MRCSYPWQVSTLRDGLHSLIDRLPESQVAPILALVRESTPTESGGDEWPLPDFVGALASGKGDLAARSAEILRSELGRDPSDCLGHRAADRRRRH
ncbi:antitoxin VapB26 [Frankia sp. AiPs1]